VNSSCKSRSPEYGSHAGALGFHWETCAVKTWNRVKINSSRKDYWTHELVVDGVMIPGCCFVVVMVSAVVDSENQRFLEDP
jgi:hypothetical protein